MEAETAGKRQAVEAQSDGKQRRKDKFPLHLEAIGESYEIRKPYFPRAAGDILLALVILLAIDVIAVMSARIKGVALKADYQEVFTYELILCAVLFLFALDVRFALFTRWKHVLLKGIG